VAQARADGFRKIFIQRNPAAWSCTPQNPLTRANTATGVYEMNGRKHMFVKPRFQLEARVPKSIGHGQGGVVLIVLPNAALAARCAKAEINMIHVFTKQPYKVIDAATIVVAPHPPGAPGESDPAATGAYEINMSRGDVLVLAGTDTRPSAAAAESKLAELAEQISGS